MLNKLLGMYIKAQLKLESFFKKEDGEVNIIAIVVLIGIAIILALVFKDRVKQLITSLFDTIDTNAKNAVNGN